MVSNFLVDRAATIATVAKNVMLAEEVLLPTLKNMLDSGELYYDQQGRLSSRESKKVIRS